MRKAHRYAVVTGKGYRPEPIQLGKWAIVGWAFIILKLLLSIVLPFLVLVWASLLRFFQAPSMAALSNVSLANYQAITLERIGAPVLNTMLLMLIVPTLTVDRESVHFVGGGAIEPAHRRNDRHAGVHSSRDPQSHLRGRGDHTGPVLVA